MTPEQIKLVQDSYEKIVPIADDAATLLYNKLFEIAPEVKPLFKSDIKEQGKKLMTMIGTAVRSLSNLEKIVPAVQKLGRSHVDYGVKEEHYGIVAEALLWTLEQGLGEAWNEELKDAWTQAYTILATTMQEAAKEVQTTPEKTTILDKIRAFLGIQVAT